MMGQIVSCSSPGFMKMSLKSPMGNGKNRINCDIRAIPHKVAYVDFV